MTGPAVFVRLLFFQGHREAGRFFAASGVQLEQSNTQYHYRRTVFSCWTLSLQRQQHTTKRDDSGVSRVTDFTD
jgi:hypothetical protein